MKSGGIAIFTKTPGVSPIKTRLAISIGRSAAEEFYCLSALAIEEIVINLIKLDSRLTPYWAVAEESQLDNEKWCGFNRLFQGHGCLGSRISTIYSEILRSHHFAILIGVDSPQLTPSMLLQTADIFQSCSPYYPYIIGPAFDGGFYLFAGNQSIPHQIWTSIPYSHPDTALKLKHSIQSLGPILEISSTFDVDTLEDLFLLSRYLKNQQFLLPSQKLLLSWTEKVLINTQN